MNDRIKTHLDEVHTIILRRLWSEFGNSLKENFYSEEVLKRFYEIASDLVSEPFAKEYLEQLLSDNIILEEDDEEPASDENDSSAEDKPSPPSDDGLADTDDTTDTDSDVEDQDASDETDTDTDTGDEEDSEDGESDEPDLGMMTQAERDIYIRNKEQSGELHETIDANDDGISDTKRDYKNIELLRNLGLSKFKEEEIYEYITQNKKEILDSLDDISFPLGTGNKSGYTSAISLNQLEKIISSEDKIRITYAGTVNKIREYDTNIRICQWNDCKQLGDSNFTRTIAIYKLYNKNKSKIDIVATPPRGISYENMQVSSLNNWFNKYDIKTPLPLYMSDDQGERDMMVSVNSCEKVSGTPKADLQLMENGKPVFWISYKHGAYKSKDGDSLASVPFQQYGSIKQLHGKLQKSGNKKWTDLYSSFFGNIRPLLNRYELGDFVLNRDNYEEWMKSNNIPTESKDSILLNLSVFDSINKSKSNLGKKKVLYITPPKFSCYFDLLDGSSDAREIAGMSIYGMDFSLNSKKYGVENVQCLIQTNQKLTVGFRDEDDDSTGINISTDNRGHIIFNPTVPAPKDADDPILIYRPVMYGRYTSDERFVVTSKGELQIFMGLRVLVMPYGKVSNNAINLGDK